MFLHPPDVTESTYELSVDHTPQQGMSLPLNVSPSVATPTDSQKGPHSEPALGVFGRSMWECTRLWGSVHLGRVCMYECTCLWGSVLVGSVCMNELSQYGVCMCVDHRS